MAGKVFKYSAQDAQGKELAGSIEAATREEALSLLARRQLVVDHIQVQEEKAGPVRADGAPPRKIGKVSLDDLSRFSYELSTLIASGLALPKALELLNDDSKMQPVVEDLLHQVRAGTSFSTALASHPQVFPPIFSALVVSGEGTGTLDRCLAQLAEFFENLDTVRNKVVSSLSYPAVVIGLALTVVIGLFLFLVPRFKEIYQTLGVTVPPITQMVLDVADRAPTILLYAAIALAVLFPLLSRWLGAQGMQRNLDRWKLKLPLLGHVFEAVSLANFNRTLAVLLKNGVHLHEAARLAGAACGNRYLTSVFDTMQRPLNEGQSLSVALAPTHLFPRKTLGMLEAGEKSGKLSDMLLKSAELEETRTQHQITRLLAFVEPLSMAVIGIFVGAAVILLGGPMLSIATAIH